MTTSETSPSKLNLMNEIKAWESGIPFVAGVDEVGRGSLAGPIVAGAVVWDQSITDWYMGTPEKYEMLIQIKDSKKLSEKKRIMLSGFIREHARAYSIYEIEAQEIDSIGISEANKNILEQAVRGLERDFQIEIGHVLVDHFPIFENGAYEVTALTKGEDQSLSIASGSIIAKVYRDTLMKEKYHNKYPEYGFDTHVGYGTKKHKEGIALNGLTPIHRQTFCGG